MYHILIYIERTLPIKTSFRCSLRFQYRQSLVQLKTFENIRQILYRRVLILFCPNFQHTFALLVLRWFSLEKYYLKITQLRVNYWKSQSRIQQTNF